MVLNKWGCMLLMNYLRSGTESYLNGIFDLGKCHVAHTITDKVSHSKSAYSLDETHLIHIHQDGKKLLTVDSDGLRMLYDTCDKIKGHLATIRNVSGLVSLLSLGAFSWKYVRGNSWKTPLNLINIIVAGALAAVALWAQYKKSELSRAQVAYPTKYAEAICQFRNYWLDNNNTLPDFNKNLVGIPDRANKMDIQFMFNSHEFVYLFHQAFTTKNYPKPESFFAFFTNPESNLQTFEGKFVNEYRKFVQTFMSDQAREELVKGYQEWIGNWLSLQDVVKELLDENLRRSEYGKRNVKRFLTCFNGCKREGKPITIEECKGVWTNVCRTMYVRQTNQDAYSYLTSKATDDFKKLLYQRVFIKDFKAACSRIDKSEIAEFKEWLEGQFKGYSDSIAKQTFMIALGEIDYPS